MCSGNAIEVEEKGDQGVGLVMRQRAWLLEGHGAVDVIEQRGGVGPVAAYRLQRLGSAQAALAAGQRAFIAALALAAVALGALTGIDVFALRGRAAAFRQARSIRGNRDVPGFDFLRRWRASHSVLRRLGEERG